MIHTTIFQKLKQAYGLLTGVENSLQSPLLLAIRLYWGYHFFLTGSGKLMHLDRTTAFFTDLGIPLPYFNALMAGTTECVGGLLLLIGLGSRLVSIPLVVTMCVAYATAEREALMNLFSNPKAFFEAEPFLFLVASLLVLVFGPGLFSLDSIVGKFLHGKTETTAAAQTSTGLKPASASSL
ncbi:MAG: DoxX family protein [Blastocatellia bacterium]|nr:DoxX family protein [Blastocatellia bacterium]